MATPERIPVCRLGYPFSRPCGDLLTFSMACTSSTPSLSTKAQTRHTPGGACDARAGGESKPCPPALTGGESFCGGAIVDWLTVTWLPEPDEHVPAMVLDFLGDFIGPVSGVESPGMFGYQSGVRFFVDRDGTKVHVGRVDFGGNHHKMRARLDLSGTACALVKEWTGVQDWIARQFDYKITRVDLAVDCLMGEFGVDDAVEWFRAGEFHAGGRRPRHSTPGDWLDPHYGRTLEIGRRENGKMLRCYEKGRQLGDSVSPWTRFEVELRNIDRDIPLDVLIDRDRYFTGAYKCLARILDAAAERIRTHQKEGEIALEKLTLHARSSYGQLLHVLRLKLSASEVLDELSRPGIPKRLEKASLGGFINAGSLPALHQKEKCHENERDWV